MRLEPMLGASDSPPWPSPGSNRHSKGPNSPEACAVNMCMSPAVGGWLGAGLENILQSVGCAEFFDIGLRPIRDGAVPEFVSLEQLYDRLGRIDLRYQLQAGDSWTTSWEAYHRVVRPRPSEVLISNSAVAFSSDETLVRLKSSQEATRCWKHPASRVLSVPSIA